MIHLLWCTIRTANFPTVHKIWKDRSKNKNFKTHILVSTESEKIFLEKYFTAINHPNRIEVFKPQYPGVCLPSYKVSSTLQPNDYDIVIFGSDDFTPPQDWDSYLDTKLSNRSGVLFVRDGYQLPDSSNMLHAAITIPIMTGDALKKMNGVIYHPAYHHMFSDCELYMTSKDLGLLIDDRLVDTTMFEHHHWAAGKRSADQNDQSYHTKWKEDELTWNKRKVMPVEERILVSNI
jgi:hypothetical protein